MKTDHGENPGVFGDVFSDGLVGKVVQAALGQDNGHTTALFQELKVALNEKDVPPDLGMPFAFLLLRQVELVENPGILDVPGKGRIGQKNVKVEIAIVLLVPSVFIRVIGKAPQAVPKTDLDFIGPATGVNGVSAVDVGSAVACDQVQGLGNLD